MRENESGFFRADGLWGWLGSVAATAAICLLAGVAAVADEFKVENSVYRADQQEPTSRSITYFVGDAVYDCMKQPAEIAIYEKSTAQFVLVDVERRIRTELATKDIVSLAWQLQQLAAKNTDPLIKFLAEPTFTEQFDEANNELTLSSQRVNYRVTLAPEASQEVVEQYREFCDWNARLNWLLTPGSLPPFGRLEVNAAVAQHRAVAAQVVRTLMATKAGQPPVTSRSEHRLVRPLTQGDLEYITHLRAALKDFKLVKFDQFRKAEER